MTSDVSLEYERLWEVGTVHLPLLARDLDEARGHLHAAAQSQAFEGLLYDATGQKWFEVCKDLERIVWRTQDALVDAAAAVRQVVTGYAVTDQAAADAIARSQD